MKRINAGLCVFLVLGVSVVGKAMDHDTTGPLTPEKVIDLSQQVCQAKNTSTESLQTKCSTTQIKHDDTKNIEEVDTTVVQHDLKEIEQERTNCVESLGCRLAVSEEEKNLKFYVPVLPDLSARGYFHLGVILSVILSSCCALPHKSCDVLRLLRGHHETVSTCFIQNEVEEPLNDLFAYMAGIPKEKQQFFSVSNNFYKFLCKKYSLMLTYCENDKHIKKLATKCLELEPLLWKGDNDTKKNNSNLEYLSASTELCQEIGKNYLVIKQWWNISHENYYLPIEQGCLKK
jgi:hypothetical protein